MFADDFASYIEERNVVKYVFVICLILASAGPGYTYSNPKRYGCWEPDGDMVVGCNPSSPGTDSDDDDD